AFPNQALLEVAADAVQHLEFEGVAWNLLSHGECFGFVDDVLVMRRQAVVDAALQQHLHELDVVGIDLRLLLESNLGRFFVCPFAQADADAIREKSLDIVLSAQHVGLDHRTHMAAIARHAMELVHASSTLVTFSPRLSTLTLMPLRLSSAATRIASST